MLNASSAVTYTFSTQCYYAKWFFTVRGLRGKAESLVGTSICYWWYLAHCKVEENPLIKGWHWKVFSRLCFLSWSRCKKAGNCVAKLQLGVPKDGTGKLIQCRCNRRKLDGWWDCAVTAPLFRRGKVRQPARVPALPRGPGDILQAHPQVNFAFYVLWLQTRSTVNKCLVDS